LREFDVGRFEGSNSEEGWDEYLAVANSWLEGDHERRVGGGESLTEIVTRLRQFLQTFLNVGQDDVHAAFIAHGGLYRMALPHVLANISPQFAFENIRGYGQLIVAESRGGSLTCVDWDEIALKLDR
jgi:broad specificity phosphatase PhoE